MVRHRILIPACEGPNPSSPAITCLGGGTVDTQDLKSCALIVRAGSSPALGTKYAELAEW